MDKGEGINGETRMPIIGITIGDCNGIGPEVILKTLASKRNSRDSTILIYGQGKVLIHYIKSLGIRDVRFQIIKDPGELKPNGIHLYNCSPEEGRVDPGSPSDFSADLAKSALEKAGKHLKKGLIDAVVTAPVSKSALQSRGFDYPGQTEFFSSLDPDSESMMLLVSENLRVGLTTGHIPLADIGRELSEKKVRQKLNILLRSLRRDFGIPKPKVGVLGINPHAGEQGKIGKEEVEWLGPLINEFKENGHYVFGPLPSDGLFGSGEYKKMDGILGMYHDQALIPFKTLAFDTGVNCTIGLNYIRTSPDHGTAFPIAGKGQASESSFRSALNLAIDLYRRRNSNS